MPTLTDSPIKFKAFEIAGERAFPSYHVSVRYQMDGTPPPGWTRSIVEGNPNRQWSSTQKRQPLYYPEPPAEGIVQAEAQAFWDAVKDQVHGPNSYGRRGTPKIPNYSDVEITVSEPRWETWCLDWFSHFTYRWDRTDKELLESFERYVRRVMESCNYDREAYGGKLMGAEDRYRWKGNGREGTDPPCVCEHCLKDGITRIDH